MQPKNNANNESFKDEILLLKNQKTIPKSNRLIALSPWLDENDIIRVRGRLRNSALPFDAKHQILLPHKHKLTHLLIAHVHKECLHGSPKLTESAIRQNYWIVDIQRTIRSVLSKGVDCFKVNPRPIHQFMGDLPASRVSVVEKPFFNTAVDFTGAFHVKMTNGRGIKSQKAYIAILVCMATVWSKEQNHILTYDVTDA